MNFWEFLNNNAVLLAFFGFMVLIVLDSAIVNYLRHRQEMTRLKGLIPKIAEPLPMRKVGVSPVDATVWQYDRGKK